MSEQFQLSTQQIIVITAKELAKSAGKWVPVLGEVISAQEAVFSAIEHNRIKSVLEEYGKRIDSIEGALRDPKKLPILVYGCDQARSDILAEAKAVQYGGVISHLTMKGAEKDEVFEVLDGLRKLSVEDLKVLYQFRRGGEIWSSRNIGEMAGFAPHVNPMGDVSRLKGQMEAMFPNLMRLQGIGVLFIAPAGRHRAGIVPPDIGRLSPYLEEFALLTEAGKRLVQALPA